MNILLNHQCPAAHTVPSDGPSYVEWYCILEKGHSGDHKDHRNRKWVNENNEGEADGGQAMNSELKKLVEKLKERAELSTVPYNDSWGKGATYGFLESVKEIEKVLAPQEAPPRLLSAPATPATKCTCGDSQNEDGCEYHGVQFYQRAEPAPAAPEVDLMEKWNARLGENCYFCRQHRMLCSEHIETRRCADELAAWLPAHDAKVRNEVLEGAAQYLEKNWSWNADCIRALKPRQRD